MIKPSGILGGFLISVSIDFGGQGKPSGYIAI
jgi:hypothetical protein